MSYPIWLAAFSLALFTSNISQAGSKAAEFEMEIYNLKYESTNGLRKYRGKDDAGNKFSFEKTLRLNGDPIKIK